MRATVLSVDSTHEAEYVIIKWKRNFPITDTKAKMEDRGWRKTKERTNGPASLGSKYQVEMDNYTITEIEKAKQMTQDIR